MLATSRLTSANLATSRLANRNRTREHAFSTARRNLHAVSSILDIKTDSSNDNEKTAPAHSHRIRKSQFRATSLVAQRSFRIATELLFRDPALPDHWRRSFCSTHNSTPGSSPSSPPSSSPSSSPGSDKKPTSGKKEDAQPTPNLPTLPPSEPALSALIINKSLSLTSSLSKSLISFFASLPSNIFYYITHPSETSLAISTGIDHAKKEAKHYFMGSKLLIAETRTAHSIFLRTLSGTPLTRRERKHLVRTTSDLLRLVPMSVFVLIPFMEFLLPVALKIFPNMLPSTFQDQLKAEENMKRELKTRIAMAGFFQETLEELAKKKKQVATTRAKKRLENDDSAADGKQVTDDKSVVGATEFLAFLDAARSGKPLSNEAVIKFAKLFEDDLTLDKMGRMQLVSMAKYMGIAPYGSDAFLRFQLRFKIRGLKEDDQRILWEGVHALTKMELMEACQERGMRSTGLSKAHLINSLQQWLDLSVVSQVPISLLIMSRTFFLNGTLATPESASSSLQDTISSMDNDVVNEIVLGVATPEEEKKNTEILKIKLDVLETENEKIKEEYEARKKEEAKKEEKKEEKKKIREEKEKEKEKEQENEKEATMLEEGAVGEILEVLEQKTSAASTTFTPDDTQPAPEEKPDSPEETSEVTDDSEDPEDSDDHDSALSPAEIDAIKELVSADPVTSEKSEVEKIKKKIEKDNEDELQQLIEEEQARLEEEARLKEEASLEEETRLKDEEEEELTTVADSTAIKTDAGSDTTTFTVDDTDPSEPTESAPAETALAANDPLDATTQKLKSKISKMLEGIESKIAEIEMSVGDKMNILDKDHDGVISVDELKDVLQHTLKRSLSDEDAQEIIDDIDIDGDGMIQVEELLQYLELEKLVRSVENESFDGLDFEPTIDDEEGEEYHATTSDISLRNQPEEPTKGEKKAEEQEELVKAVVGKVEEKKQKQQEKEEALAREEEEEELQDALFAEEQQAPKKD